MALLAKKHHIAPSEFIGTIMELCQQRRGELGGMDYLSPERVELRYTMPLGEIIFDFFDSLDVFAIPVCCVIKV